MYLTCNLVSSREGEDRGTGDRGTQLYRAGERKSIVSPVLYVANGAWRTIMWRGVGCKEVERRGLHLPRLHELSVVPGGDAAQSRAREECLSGMYKTEGEQGNNET